MKDLRYALANHTCGAAVKTLAVVAFNAGKVRSDRIAAGHYMGTKRIPHTVVLKLAQRVAHVCGHPNPMRSR